MTGCFNTTGGEDDRTFSADGSLPVGDVIVIIMVSACALLWAVAMICILWVQTDSKPSTEPV
jgi:hypothetical protein